MGTSPEPSERTAVWTPAKSLKSLDADLIELKAEDGSTVSISRSTAATYSGTLRHLIEDCEYVRSFRVPTTSAGLMLTTSLFREDARLSPHCCRTPLAQLFSAHRAAIFLDAPTAQVACAKAILPHFQGKTPDELRRMLDVPNDLSASQAMAARREPLLTPPAEGEEVVAERVGVSRIPAGRVGDEDAIQAFLAVFDARTLRTLKGISQAWRWRARQTLGSTESEWRRGPLFLAPQTAARTVHAALQCTTRNQVLALTPALKRLGALDPAVELPALLADLNLVDQGRPRRLLYPTPSEYEDESDSSDGDVDPAWIRVPGERAPSMAPRDGALFLPSWGGWEQLAGSRAFRVEIAQIHREHPQAPLHEYITGLRNRLEVTRSGERCPCQDPEKMRLIRRNIQAFAELVNEVVEEKTFEELLIRKAASASAADESAAEQPDVIEQDVIEQDVIEPDSELDADSDDDEDEGAGDAVPTAAGDESPQKQGSVGLIACARPVRGRPILLRTRALQLLGLVEHGVFEALGLSDEVLALLHASFETPLSADGGDAGEKRNLDIAHMWLAALALLQALTPGSHQATLRAPAIDLTSLGDVLMSLMERCLDQMRREGHLSVRRYGWTCVDLARKVRLNGIRDPPDCGPMCGPDLTPGMVRTRWTPEEEERELQLALALCTCRAAALLEPTVAVGPRYAAAAVRRLLAAAGRDLTELGIARPDVARPEAMRLAQGQLSEALSRLAVALEAQ